MVSQPLVAGWLAGLVVGEPAAGLAVGVVLQAVWGRAFALGGASFPLVGPAAVVGGGLAGWSLGPSAPLGTLAVPQAAPLAACLAAAFLVAETGRPAVMAMRRRRGGLVRRAVAEAEAGRGGALVRTNLRGVGESALLGAAITGAGLAVGWLGLVLADLLPAADGRWVAVPVLAAGLGYSVTQVARGGKGWIWLAATVGLAAVGWFLA
jgi:mannose/fructose/N-acetylgalactosamine-specific phosphotransferase system component IIC